MPREVRGKWGGINLLIESRQKATWHESNGPFGPHSTYVVGEPVADAEEQKLCVALSTENLLLNAYRQSQSGLPPLLQVDTTHKLVLEGHNCMLFGTVDAAQKWHTVGFGVCSEEDTEAHTTVCRALREEVHTIVRARAAEAQRGSG